MHAITIINGQSMRFEVFDPVPTGTELTTTEGDHVLFEGIDDAGLLLCSRKVDGQISAYFPHDLLLPANPEAENRRARVELACQRLRAAIGNDLVSAARVSLLSMNNQIQEGHHAEG